MKIRSMFSPDNLVNKLPRTLGMELELAEWGNLRKYNPSRFAYSMTHDWSVKPSENEMVISPLYGDQYLRAMIELGWMLQRYGGTVNSTCAYHVHVGGNDLSYWEIRKLLRVYEKLEKQIYQHLVLPHRRNDPTVEHYCQLLTVLHERCERCVRYDRQYPGQRLSQVPLAAVVGKMNQAKSSREIKQALIHMLYRMSTPKKAMSPEAYADWANTLQTRKGGKYEWCRYVGLNLHAWMHRGTVEWRMKEGTLDLEELITWPLWCGWFVEAAARMTEAESLASYMDLVDFTARWMPRWITDWVVKMVGRKHVPEMVKYQPVGQDEPEPPATVEPNLQRRVQQANMNYWVQAENVPLQNVVRAIPWEQQVQQTIQQDLQRQRQQQPPQEQQQAQEQPQNVRLVIDDYRVAQRQWNAAYIPPPIQREEN